MIIRLFTILILFVFVAVTILWLTRVRRSFFTMRRLSLSTASQCDAVGGVGISMLLASPVDIRVVVSLLDSRYPLSEVVVALCETKQHNLLSQLKLRYSLALCSAEGCKVYRSRIRTFRRLVVVVTDVEYSRDEMTDLAAQNALFDYLLRVPSKERLLPFAVGTFADRIASMPNGRVDCLTSSERDVILLSRRTWLARGGFSSIAEWLTEDGQSCIDEPISLLGALDSRDMVVIERARYNFLDYLALNIMKYRKKVLSLIKP